MKVDDRERKGQCSPGIPALVLKSRVLPGILRRFRFRLSG